MTVEQARDLILAEAAEAETEYPHGFPPNDDCQLDYDCPECDCPRCACIHPVDADIIAHLEEDAFYAEAQDLYLANLTKHEMNMYDIERQPTMLFAFELKRNGKLVKIGQQENDWFDEVPF